MNGTIKNLIKTTYKKHQLIGTYIKKSNQEISSNALKQKSKC